ncbi:MAG TPA: GGDEF domain-containing protein, partial [Rhizobiaceae bacterium]|nr:GGDEF domain-containing protein [Rhizobiaceae bacterium]
SQERTRNGEKKEMMMEEKEKFKRIKDTFGHLAGDDALIAVAQTLREAVGDGGLCGRIGGEEFGVLLASADEAERVAQEIRSAVEAIGFHPAAGIRQPLTVSIGGVAGRAGAVVTDLFRNADRHLYEAKDQGRNRVVFRAAA